MRGPSRFADRRDAGRRLAERVRRSIAVDDLHDPLVLALPRGGVPVAVEVAAALGAELDVLVARKVGLPGHPEVGIGAVAEGGVRVAGAELLARAGLDRATFDRLADLEVTELERRVRAYRADRPLAATSGRDVIVVDDGLATGVTARAGAQAVRTRGAARLVLAVPVCARDTAERLARSDDVEVVCVLRPRRFVAVGEWYDDFEQETDERVVELLTAARLSR